MDFQTAVEKYCCESFPNMHLTRCVWVSCLFSGAPRILVNWRLFSLAGRAGVPKPAAIQLTLSMFDKAPMGAEPTKGPILTWGVIPSPPCLISLPFPLFFQHLFNIDFHIDFNRFWRSFWNVFGVKIRYVLISFSC